VSGTAAISRAALFAGTLLLACETLVSHSRSGSGLHPRVVFAPSHLDEDRPAPSYVNSVDEDVAKCKADYVGPYPSVPISRSKWPRAGSLHSASVVEHTVSASSRRCTTAIGFAPHAGESYRLVVQTDARNCGVQIRNAKGAVVPAIDPRKCEDR